jgi:twinkle protein
MWGVFSAESLPHELHIADLMEQYVRKPFNDGYLPRISPAERDAALKFIDAHFTYIAPPEEQETVERILACAQRLCDAKKLDGLVIDPWNELNHAWHERGLTETEYISRMLKNIRRFAAQWQVHVIVVAHPMKLTKDRSGNYPVPTPYDVSGSAHWRNKADCALCVWRDESRPGETVIFVQKVRRKFVGRIGRADLRYDAATGTFADWAREPGEDDK